MDKRCDLRIYISQSPGFKLDTEGKPDPASKEPFSEEARYFTESRLLQRDVEVVLESVNNQNYVGSIIHPVSLGLICGRIV
jgi:hypothetical protein